jgi:hypothetical protein
MDIELRAGGQSQTETKYSYELVEAEIHSSPDTKSIVSELGSDPHQESAGRCRPIVLRKV